MAWIDYKKAFDSVPHSWILASLNMYRAQDTNHRSDCTKTDKISIKRGIFQSDSFAPHFCLALTPLSNMLNILNIGYKIESNQQMSHLLYMDDLKIFTRTEAHLSKAL